MILLYAAACAAVLAWRLRTRWRAWVAKRGYERAESAFREAERVCKLDEVQLGRPAGYAGQLKLLKAFESREERKARWTRAAQGVARAGRAWAALRGFHGRRTSYFSGALDVALVWLAQRHAWELSADALNWLALAKKFW